MSLIIISVIIIIYLLYLNDKKVSFIEKFSVGNGFDYLTGTQNDCNLQKCIDNSYYIQCVIFSNKKNPIDSKKNIESARYNLYFDKLKNILRFGKITKDVNGINTYKDTENDSKDYMLNDTELIKIKDFRFKISKIGSQYRIRPHDYQFMYLTNLNEGYDIYYARLLKQKKDGYEIDNYKIMYEDNNPLIVSFLDENQNINFNFDNDLLCEFYNYDYKKKLSSIINPKYLDHTSLENTYENYKSQDLIDYFYEKKNIEVNNSFDYCPFSYPYPYDTIEKSILIDDDENIDFKINFNNKCCSVKPDFKLKDKELEDKVSQEKLEDNELDKINKYLINNGIKLFNNCPGDTKHINSDKRKSILILKEDQRVEIVEIDDESFPKKIEDLDSIITDTSLYSQEYSNKNPNIDLSFHINQRTLFEFKCVKGASQIKIQGVTGKEGGGFTSSDSEGSTTG